MAIHCILCLSKRPYIGSYASLDRASVLGLRKLSLHLTVVIANLPHLQLMCRRNTSRSICSGSLPLSDKPFNKGLKKMHIWDNPPYLGLRWAGMLADNPVLAKQTTKQPSYCVPRNEKQKNLRLDLVIAIWLSTALSRRKYFGLFVWV